MFSKVQLISTAFFWFCLFVVCSSRSSSSRYSDTNGNSGLSRLSSSSVKNRRSQSQNQFDESSIRAALKFRAARDDRGDKSDENGEKNKKLTRYTLFAIESPPGQKSISFENTIKFVKTSLDLIDEFEQFPEIKFFVDRKSHKGHSARDRLPYRYSLLSLDLSQNETKHNLDKIVEFVKDSADLHAPQPHTVEKDKMEINIKTATGKTIKLDVEPADTVESIKAKIEQKEGVIIDHQKLLFDGQTLDDEGRISDYKIKNNSTVEAHFVIQFFVKVGQEMTVTLRAFQSDTVRSVKEKLLDLGGDLTAVEKIKLTFDGQELDNVKRLLDYNIVKDSTIEATVIKSSQVNATAPAAT